ncbi:MAG: hypothetical protein QMD78_03520 [Methanocellales archaeon]|nr:hypothetical protein [Methanocellales archaeon]
MKSIDDVPEEELRELYCLNLDIFITTLESLEKVIGKEAPLSIIRLCSKELGDRIERGLRKRTKTREWTPKTFSVAFVDYLNDLGLEAELVRASDEEIIIRKHMCAMGEFGKRYPKVCAYRIGSLLESAKKALGKEMELKHVKNILKGDPYCEFVLEIK